MALYDVELALVVAGIGPMPGRNQTVMRRVTAQTLEEAIAQAKKDVLTVTVISAKPATPAVP